jgi:hypothetical protein
LYFSLVVLSTVACESQADKLLARHIAAGKMQRSLTLSRTLLEAGLP